MADLLTVSVGLKTAVGFQKLNPEVEVGGQNWKAYTYFVKDL